MCTEISLLRHVIDADGTNAKVKTFRLLISWLLFYPFLAFMKEGEADYTGWLLLED